MTTNEKVLSDLLNRACEIITSLEGYANEHSHYPEHNKELQKTIDNFFNEVDMLNDPNWLFPGAPLHDDDPEDVEWLKAHNADMEAQDGDLFGENKI